MPNKPTRTGDFVRVFMLFYESYPNRNHGSIHEKLHEKLPLMPMKWTDFTSNENMRSS
jgi:hypothetical protein